MLYTKGWAETRQSPWVLTLGSELEIFRSVAWPVFHHLVAFRAIGSHGIDTHRGGGILGLFPIKNFVINESIN